MEPSSKTGLFYRHEALLVFFMGLLLLLPGIWCETGITGQDEYWLSFRTPMETMERGDWVTPWVNGEPRLKKPPLLYWAIMLSYRLLGIGLFSARIWGVLAGAGLAACSTLLYRELFRRSGLLAGLITLASIAVVIEGRRAMLDLPLAYFTAMAVFFAIRWGKTGNQGWILLSGLSLGLSFLVKGPVGMVLFVVASLSCQGHRRHPSGVPLLHLGGGLRSRLSLVTRTPCRPDTGPRTFQVGRRKRGPLALHMVFRMRSPLHLHTVIYALHDPPYPGGGRTLRPLA
ncbi:MAG: glycosyltransferase family 39 protein [Deltaproteobacteria bacterium]|nr:glycosyltransferase family 39 protein [Deltaproteobacteria bacterium]